MEEIKRLEGLLPEDFPILARNSAFVALLRSIGDKETRQALRSQLMSRPLAVEAADREVPAAEQNDPAQEEGQNQVSVELQ